MFINLEKIVRQAGDEILKIYADETSFQVVDFKADDSPLTLADKASHEVIDALLKEHFPDIPVLSEEGKNIEYNERKDWQTFWCVDPLDGTKEFIKRNGEFTVNIALIKDGYPSVGIIYAPVLDILYYGNEETGERFKIEKGIKVELAVNHKASDRIAVRSRSHASPEESELLNSYGVTDEISVGSSLKFCMVAEGKADIYYRHGPTMEWDTAAGQAILEASGGSVSRLDEEQRFYYNKENLLNPGFLSKGF